jgi:hypothetical protein
MELLISVALAYVFCGIATVMKDLNAQPIDRPQWAFRPTLRGAIFIAATWWARSFVDGPGPVRRRVAFALMGAVSQLGVLTFFIWGCIAVSIYFFTSAPIQIASAAVLVVVGSQIVLPLLSFLMIPVTLLVAWPLDLLFPLEQAKGRR